MSAIIYPLRGQRKSEGLLRGLQENPLNMSRDEYDERVRRNYAERQQAEADARYEDFDIADAVKIAEDVYDYSKFPQKIHEGNQGKHIIGNNEYQSERGRSIVTISVEKIMELVKKYTGTGRCHNSYRETVDFGEVIGKYIDPETGIAYDTTRVTIHYSQKGFHIVPAKPENWRKK